MPHTHSPPLPNDYLSTHAHYFLHTPHKLPRSTPPPLRPDCGSPDSNWESPPHSRAPRHPYLLPHFLPYPPLAGPPPTAPSGTRFKSPALPPSTPAWATPRARLSTHHLIDTFPQPHKAPRDWQANPYFLANTPTKPERSTPPRHHQPTPGDRCAPPVGTELGSGTHAQQVGSSNFIPIAQS